MRATDFGLVLIPSLTLQPGQPLRRATAVGPDETQLSVALADWMTEQKSTEQNTIEQLFNCRLFSWKFVL